MTVATMTIVDNQRTSLLHGTSAQQDSSFMSMVSKDSHVQSKVMGEYLTYWDNKDSSEKASKDSTEVNMVNKQVFSPPDPTKSNLTSCSYYDLVTDLFEYGWGQSFHFCRFQIGESFANALARHEYYLASMLHIKPGDKVLDAGCGVGGPARQIGAFTGANITGITINAYQVQRARKLTELAGLSKQVEFMQANFLETPFADNSFDSAYAIEATLHAPQLEQVYSEVYRVLKPGSTFAFYEWCLTPKYDDRNTTHQRIRRGIEHGDGIPTLRTQDEALAALKASGFELVHAADIAVNNDQRPWWSSLTGEWKYVSGIWDAITMMRGVTAGRYATQGLLKVLETFRLCPPGTLAAAQTLETGAANLIEGGRTGIFTPMFLMVGRKPLA